MPYSRDRLHTFLLYFWLCLWAGLNLLMSFCTFVQEHCHIVVLYHPSLGHCSKRHHSSDSNATVDVPICLCWTNDVSNYFICNSEQKIKIQLSWTARGSIAALIAIRHGLICGYLLFVCNSFAINLCISTGFKPAVLLRCIINFMIAGYMYYWRRAYSAQMRWMHVCDLCMYLYRLWYIHDCKRMRHAVQWFIDQALTITTELSRSSTIWLYQFVVQLREANYIQAAADHSLVWVERYQVLPTKLPHASVCRPI